MLTLLLLAALPQASAADDLASLEKCARGLSSAEWYKVLDERFAILPDSDAFFRVMIGAPAPEEGIAVLHGRGVEFYSTKAMRGEEARIAGKRVANAVAEFELGGKPFHVRFQERPDEPGIHAEILPSEGASEKDDPWPKTFVKGRPLSEAETVQFRKQAERILKAYVSKFDAFRKANPRAPRAVPAECPK